ncbi:MAG: hypothetical protein WCZ16_08890 [Desulfosarcinaceae bacterium]
MTDRPGENRPAPFFGLGADLKALAGAIGWLAGAMSGVVALMYAVGFLCAKSHLYMLGIETHSGVPAGAYVEIGAKFFYITLCGRLWSGWRGGLEARSGGGLASPLA